MAHLCFGWGGGGAKRITYVARKCEEFVFFFFRTLIVGGRGGQFDPIP